MYSLLCEMTEQNIQQMHTDTTKKTTVTQMNFSTKKNPQNYSIHSLNAINTESKCR